MRQTVHALLGSNVDAAIQCCLFSEVVFFDDFVLDVAQFHSDEFRSVQRCHEVKVGDVHCHEACAFCGDGGGGGNFSRIVDSVSSDSELCLIGFSLFGSYCAHKLPVHNVSLLLFWYLVLVNELVVLVGFFILLPMPFANHPNLLANERLHAFLYFVLLTNCL